MKIAYLFPGQGSQYTGMGRTLAQDHPEARAVFEEADDALGFAISKLCFEGPDNELKLTHNTQPAILTVSTAAYRVLEREMPAPNFVAGHSLGEYTACVATGTLRFFDAVRLVRKRGQYMQQAVPAGVGAMAALLKLPEGKLDGILAEASVGEVVTAANYNSPDQIVIAGHTGAVSRAMDLAKIAGARRVVALPVSAPFHCPLMIPAQEQMRPELDAIEFAELSFPLINNFEARKIATPEEAREGLLQQIASPVRWTDTIRKLASFGVVRSVEVGPGAVLTALLRSIDSSLQGFKFGESSDMEALKTS